MSFGLPSFLSNYCYLEMHPKRLVLSKHYTWASCIALLSPNTYMDMCGNRLLRFVHGVLRTTLFAIDDMCFSQCVRPRSPLIPILLTMINVLPQVQSKLTKLILLLSLFFIHEIHTPKHTELLTSEH